MDNEMKFNIFLCKDDFINVESKNHRFFVEETGLWPRQDIDPTKNVMVNVDYSILVSLLGQGYIRCLNNLTASGQGGIQLADTLRNIINKFVTISYQNFDETLSNLKIENFELIKYLIEKDVDGPQKSILRMFSLVDKVELKQSLGERPYHVGYHYDDSNAVISYNVDFFNTAPLGAQFASYLAMLATLVSRINNKYAFTTLLLFLLLTNNSIDEFGGYDSLEKMQNVTIATCKAVHDYINNPKDSENIILKFINNNPKGFMLMNAGIPEFK